MMTTAPSRRVKPSEEGYILVAVMFMIALLIISMAVALPKVAADIQRDRELETYHRGMQYRRAIQLYFKKFQRYPPNMEALIKTNEIRFLRKKYIDPTTGKDDWKPIQFGQNKTPMAMGFFGQPLGGVGFGGGMMAGTGPAGGNGIAGASTIGGSSFGSSNPGGAGSFGSTNTVGGGSFGSTNSIGSTSPTGAAGTSDRRNGCQRQSHRSQLRDQHRNADGRQPHRGTGIWRRSRHHRCLARQRERVDLRLQEEKPLQRVGVPLQSAERPWACWG